MNGISNWDIHMETLDPYLKLYFEMKSRYFRDLNENNTKNLQRIKKPLKPPEEIIQVYLCDFDIEKNLNRAQIA